MTVSHTTRVVLRPLVGIAVVVGLAACSGGGEPSGGGSGAPTSAASTTVPAEARVTTVDDKGGVGAIKDLTGSRCTHEKGVWSLTGTVHNTSRSAQTYTVEASVVNPQGWGVVDSTTTRVTVAAGEKRKVEAEAFHTEKPADAAAHRCVTRVVRHAAS